MKVAVVTNMAPFVWGGAEELASQLCTQLVEHGHRAELIRIPFQWEPAERIPSQMLLARWLQLYNVDHVIALKFPAYLIPHPSKTIWLVHQFRQAYDLHEAGMSNLPAGAAGDSLRKAIMNADAEAFAEAREIFTISPDVSDRLMRYSGLAASALRAPLNDPHRFVGGPPGSYIFAGGRINTMKRQHLLVEGLAHADPHVRLVIAGPPDSPADRARIEETVVRLGLEDRVHLDLRFLERDRYADYVNKAAVVAYLPYKEDSFGYVTMEAAEAGRAVITTADSGGVLGLVRNGETGWVVDPEPEALGGALTAAIRDRDTAQSLGRAAQSLWRSMGISWTNTIEALVP